MFSKYQCISSFVVIFNVWWNVYLNTTTTKSSTFTRNTYVLWYFTLGWSKFQIFLFVWVLPAIFVIFGLKNLVMQIFSPKIEEESLIHQNRLGALFLVICHAASPNPEFFAFLGIFSAWENMLNIRPRWFWCKGRKNSNKQTKNAFWARLLTYTQIHSRWHSIENQLPCRFYVLFTGTKRPSFNLGQRKCPDEHLLWTVSFIAANDCNFCISNTNKCKFCFTFILHPKRKHLIFGR